MSLKAKVAGSFAEVPAPGWKRKASGVWEPVSGVVNLIWTSVHSTNTEPGVTRSGFAATDTYTCGGTTANGRTSSTTGNWIQLDFTGSGIRWWTRTTQTLGNGIAGLSIDGGAETTLDTASAVNADSCWMAYEATGLAHGAHTFRVRVTGNIGAGTTAMIYSLRFEYQHPE